MRVNSEQLTNQLYEAVDLLRGTNEHHEAVAAVLGLLFWKRLSDEAENEGLPRAQAADARYSVYFPAEARWSQLLHRQPTGIAEAFGRAQESLEQANPQLPQVFTQGELLAALSPKRLGNRERVLFDLLQSFQRIRLADEDLATPDTLGLTFKALLHRTATVDQRTGTSFTPPTVAQLIAALLNPQSEEKLYDPVCGSAGLLAACVAQTQSSLVSRQVEVFGRERLPRMWALSCVNLYFNRAKAEIRLGDSLRDPPIHDAAGRTQTFDIVVADPPFSLPWESRAALPFAHLSLEVPLRNSDYAFIQHALAVTNQRGRVAILMPHGVLFRSGGEEVIRRRLIENDEFEAVIGLAPQLFYGTNIAVCLLIFNRAKSVERKGKVLFVDASRKFSYDRLLRQLSGDAIKAITECYRDFSSHEGYARVVGKDEIAKNDFDLSIARYVRAEDMTETLSLESELNRLSSLLADRTEAETRMIDALRQVSAKSDSSSVTQK